VETDDDTPPIGTMFDLLVGTSVVHACALTKVELVKE
jgi:hypothetical protein